MKKKNSKLIQNLVIFASGLTLLNFCLYKGYSVIAKAKPFKDNKYKATRVYSTELTEDGEINKRYYSCENINKEEKETIIFKTPYFKNADGEYERNNYLIPTSSYTEEQVNIIKENIDDQDMLLDQNFILESIINIDDAPNLNIYKVERVSEIPDDNKYEVTYLTRREKENDVIYVPNRRQDVVNNFIFSFVLLGSDTIYTTAYISSKNKQKKKTINK